MAAFYPNGEEIKVGDLVITSQPGGNFKYTGLMRFAVVGFVREKTVDLVALFHQKSNKRLTNCRPKGRHTWGVPSQPSAASIKVVKPSKRKRLNDALESAGFICITEFRCWVDNIHKPQYEDGLMVTLVKIPREALPKHFELAYENAFKYLKMKQDDTFEV